MKKKGFKNYLILFVIIAITVIVFLYVFSWYKQYKDSSLINPVISDTLREITYEDISAVTKERDFLFVYTCTSKEDKCRVFEEKFSNYIKSQDLSDHIVYIKLGDNSDEKKTQEITKKVIGAGTSTAVGLKCAKYIGKFITALRKTTPLPIIGGFFLDCVLSYYLGKTTDDITEELIPKAFDCFNK